jgi:hypothetical protein
VVVEVMGSGLVDLGMKDTVAGQLFAFSRGGNGE